MTLRQRLAVAFILSTSLAGPAFAGAENETRVRDFIAGLDSSPLWKASEAKIFSDGTKTVVEGLHVALEDGSVQADLASLTLDGMTLPSNGGLDLTGFIAANARLAGKSWTFTSPGISGSSLKLPDLTKWRFDPKAPATSLATLYTDLAKAEFNEITVATAALAQTLPLAGNGQTVNAATTYTDMRMGPMSKGVVAVQSIGKMEQTMSSPGPAMTNTMEGLEGKNIDLAAVAYVFDPANYKDGKGDGQWRNAVESVSYAHIATRQGGKDVFSLGPVTMGTLEIRQPPQPLAPAFDHLITMGSAPNEAETLAFMERNFSSLVGWFRVSSLSFRDLKGASPDGGTFALAEISLDDLSADGLKRAAMKDLSADGPQFKAVLAAAEVNDVVWPSIKPMFALGRLEESKKSGNPDPKLAEDAAGDFLQMVPRIGRIALNGFAAGTGGENMIRLESYEAMTSGQYALLPDRVTGELKNLSIPQSILQATPESKALFDTLGYTSLTMHMNGEGNYDAASGRYAATSTLSVNDAGALKLSYALGALTPDRIRQTLIPIFMAPKDGEPNPLAMMSAVGPISLENFVIRFEDSSLTKRLLTYASKLQGVDEATLIGNLAAVAQLGLSQLRQPEFTAQTVTAMTRFLKDPHAITFAISPSRPVELRQLMSLDKNDPGAAINLLGISVKAND